MPHDENVSYSDCIWIYDFYMVKMSMGKNAIIIRVVDELAFSMVTVYTRKNVLNAPHI